MDMKWVKLKPAFNGHWRVLKLGALLAICTGVVLGEAALKDDALFRDPYVDKDEWREKPVRHRYVHGGFRNSETRFSFYFPPKERYEGRFFQHITPIPISENLAQRSTGPKDYIGFSVSSGGYFVESNGGGMSTLAPGNDGSIGGFRANAAVARYSRVLAAEMYGPHRSYGYAFGGSGGGFKTIAGFENTDAWDGAVPYVIGSPMAIPNVFTIRALALRVLKDKLPAIVDAVEAGGNGDMYAGLNDEERAVLTEVTRMGFPPRGWFLHQTLGLGALPVLFPSILAKDPKTLTSSLFSIIIVTRSRRPSFTSGTNSARPTASRFTRSARGCSAPSSRPQARRLLKRAVSTAR